MNRLTFFKRLFNVAAVATIAPKAEASQGLSITKGFKKQSPIDKAMIKEEPMPTIYLRGNDMYLPL